jgi:hypothetical protein
MMRSSDNEILARVDQGAPIGEVMRRYWRSICTVDEVLSRTAIPSGANFWGLLRRVPRHSWHSRHADSRRAVNSASIAAPHWPWAEWRGWDLLPPPRLEVRGGRHHSRHARSLRRALSGAHQGTGLSRGRRGGRPSLDLHWPEGQAAAAPSLRLHGARPGSEPCSPTADTKALGRAGPIVPTSASSTAISPTRAGWTKAFRHPMSGKPLPPPMAWTA